MPPISRRGLLAAGSVVGSTVVVSCRVNSPVVRGGPDDPPEPPGTGPSAPLLAGAVRGAALERECQRLAGALVVTEDADPRWARLSRLHQERAELLERTDPLAVRLGEPASPGPSPAPPGSPSPSAEQTPSSEQTPAGDDVRSADWRAGLDAAAAHHRGAALAARGQAALLWASLAAWSVGAPRAELVAPTPRPDLRQPVPTATALVDLVTALHQVVYGYQLSLAAVPAEDRDEVAQRLTALLALRDDTSARLVELAVEVPVAEPAYDVEPGSESDSVRLRRRLETGLLPWLGRWVLADPAPPTTGELSDEATEAAVDALRRSVAAASLLQAELGPWPGY